MRWRGPLTFRHMIVAALVMVLVNAQLTWWIVFALRQNRSRLDLERQLLVEEAEHHALRIESALLHAELELTRAFAEPTALPRTLQHPFVAMSLSDEAGCAAGWRSDGIRLEYQFPRPEGCRLVVIDPPWLVSLLEVGDSLELGASAISHDSSSPQTSIPEVRLCAPFEESTLHPRSEAWSEILADYRGRIVMMVSEGGFFAIMLLVLIGLLWKTMRREVELERRHRNFLSAITHELKSPLAGVRLSLETILRSRADASTSLRFLENALLDTERLQSLVQKVLEVTRFSGGDNVQPRTTSLSEVVEEAIQNFSRRTSTSAVELEAAILPNVIAKVDIEAFLIVVSNLLENALKYGGAVPQIRVRLDRARGKAVLDITDNGGGIATEEVPFVFERFYRCGDEMTRTAQGTGLGLFLVKEIVASHGGRVTIAETGSSGTTFRVTLDEVDRWEDSR